MPLTLPAMNAGTVRRYLPGDLAMWIFIRAN
jgi:hypothetical protein